MHILAWWRPGSAWRRGEAPPVERAFLDVTGEVATGEDRPALPGGSDAG